MEIAPILKRIGLNDKEIKIYLTLLESGPASVRKLAEAVAVNRGTTYDVLKSLLELGLVSYYHKATKQFFVAEDPKRLIEATEVKIKDLSDVKEHLVKIIPELKSLHDKAGTKPVVKYYEGNLGVKTILQDVLEAAFEARPKKYYVFSSASIRPYLYSAYPEFTGQRIKKGIEVEAIAIGQGGEPAKLSKRKWLTQKEGSPTYILIYADKVAMISVNEEKTPLGLIVEDKALYQTQLQLFRFIWENLIINHRSSVVKNL